MIAKLKKFLARRFAPREVPWSEMTLQARYDYYIITKGD